jgi:hypothetical protein
MRRIKVNKTTIIALVLIVVLAIGFGVGLYFLLDQNKDLRHLYENEEIRINIFGQELGVFTFAQLEALAPAENFNAVFKPSGRPAIERVYLGIELRKLLAALGVDLNEISGVGFISSDGYQNIYPRDWVLQESEVFITVVYENKVFQKGISVLSSYPEEDGGPFVVIKASDLFSNNRVRLLVEINVV